MRINLHLSIGSPELDIDGLAKALNDVGWFLPPYLSLGFLLQIKEQAQTDSSFDQNALGQMLSAAYGPIHLASMVMNLYGATVGVKDYKGIIGESIEAHFLNLDHVAVSGLMPVVEGAARRLAKSRSLVIKDSTPIKAVLEKLAKDCIRQVTHESIGVPHEFVAMISSFYVYARDYFYVGSKAYPLPDNTERHGTEHGVYGDKDYGTPINFYKTLSAVDMLCTMAGFGRNAPSLIAPSPSEESTPLSAYFMELAAISMRRPA
jgi:hypothetical protein